MLIITNLKQANCIHAQTIMMLVSIFWIQGLSAQDLEKENFDCLIEPKMTVMVGAPTQGIIDSVTVERSDFVDKGQVLATLQSNVEQAAMKHSQARATMKSEIQAREADQELAEINLRRIEKLISKKMVPQQQLDEAIAQVQVAQMAVKQAKDNRRLNEYEYARAKAIVERRVIRSPISGVIVEQRAFPGEFVNENPVLSIAQLDPLQVEAILPARLFGQLEEGMLANVVPEINSINSLEGVILSVDRLIDTASGTFSVHVELANPDNAIPAGQRCTVEFRLPHATEKATAMK